MGFVLLLLQIVVCFVLIMVVLLQSGKAADLAGAFGGGGSQTALGSRGAATFLTKATTTCAVLFMMTSLGLALVGSQRDASVLETLPAEESAPAALPSAGEAGAASIPPVEGEGAGISDEPLEAADDPSGTDAAGTDEDAAVDEAAAPVETQEN